ncbi:MAG: bifunctional nuclease family protein, partial [Thermoprotei archaeon]
EGGIRVSVLGVYRVKLREGREGDVVFLVEEEGGRVLPIWIGESEAMSIQMVIKGEKPPRPLTHDLLVGILEATGFEVDRIKIDGLIQDTYTSSLYIRNLSTGKTLRVDSRPSDAIAVALRVGCEIYVDDSLREQMVPKDRFKFPDEAGGSQAE